jgi:hypothetical protein
MTRGFILATFVAITRLLALDTTELGAVRVVLPKPRAGTRKHTCDSCDSRRAFLKQIISLQQMLCSFQHLFVSVTPLQTAEQRVRL